jgi:type VI secretion system secreted protein VgrG
MANIRASWRHRSIQVGLLVCFGASPATAQTAPTLGDAVHYAVLGGSTVTSTGATVLTGDLGVSPGSAITGFPPGVLTGFTHAGTAPALAGQNSAIIAFDALGSQACTQDLTGQDLGGLTLTPGVYCFSTSAQLTGTLTLNALGNNASVFIFKTGSTLTTATSSAVVVINDGAGLLCAPYWRIGSSATLGTTTRFIGNILALTSVTLNTSASVLGRALARNGAVTLDSNQVSANACTAGTSSGPTPTPVPTLPQWFVVLLAIMLTTVGYLRLRRRQQEISR